MKKLKSIDFKALFLDHGEKMGFGVIVLTVLLVVLPGLSSGWGREKRSPTELLENIKQATDKIDSPANSWPNEKKEKYVVVDFTDKARDIFKGLDAQKYEFSQPHMFWPLYQKKEKAKEPEYLAPQFLLADAGRASLGMSNTSAADLLAANSVNTEDMAKASDSALPDDFKPGGPSASGKLPGMPSPAAGHGPAAGPGPGQGNSKSTGTNKKGASLGPGGGHGSSGSPSPYMSQTGSSSSSTPSGVGGSITARGVRYVAIRAIIPLREQKDKFIKALNLTSREEASSYVEYTDFVLERQAAVAGPNPWPEKWEVVDVKSALETLAESADFDPDPVPSELQDAVITMQLPHRLIRYWKDHATHPQIANFQLPPEEAERIAKMEAKLVEEFEKLKLVNTPKVQRRGFAAVQNDIRGMAKTVGSSAEASNVMKSMSSYMAESGARPMAASDIQSRLLASGHLYLFRYFDFDVKPGMAYRYRVKLQLRNPNFERAYEEVENPEFTRDPYRYTGWSNISSVAVVPESVHYFLKDVERDPIEDKPSKRPIANISMFEWDPKLGTMLADTLRILSIGQFIGEKAKKTTVIDPGTPGSYDEKEVSLMTEDILVDATGDLELSPDFHPDLGLRVEKGKKEIKLGLLPEAIVCTPAGRLKELDPVSEAAQEKSMADYVANERKSCEHLQTVKEPETTDKNNAFRMMMTPAQSSSSPTGPATAKKPSARKKIAPGR